MPCTDRHHSKDRHQITRSPELTACNFLRAEPQPHTTQGLRGARLSLELPQASTSSPSMAQSPSVAAASMPPLEAQAPETAPIAVQSLATSTPAELQNLEAAQSSATPAASDAWSKSVKSDNNSKRPTTPSSSPKTPEPAPTAAPSVAPLADPFEAGVLLETFEGGKPSPGTLRAFEEKSEKTKQSLEKRKFMTLEQAESETLLRVGSASIHGNNCLLVSVAQVSDMLHPSTDQSDRTVTAAVQGWRAQQLNRLLTTLQEVAPDAGAARWDAGSSRTLVQDNFDEAGYLGQVHIVDIAEQTKKTMLVLQPASDQPPSFQSGGDRLIASVYAPGYPAPREDVDKEEVKLLLKREEKDVRVLFLENGHFSPLLSKAQRDASFFAPRELLSVPAEGAVKGAEGAVERAEGVAQGVEGVEGATEGAVGDAEGPWVPSTAAEEKELLARTLAASRCESSTAPKPTAAPAGMVLRRVLCSDVMRESFFGSCPEGYEMAEQYGGGLFADTKPAARLTMLNGTVLMPLEKREAGQPLQLWQLQENCWSSKQADSCMALVSPLDEQPGLTDGKRVYVPQDKPERVDLSLMAAACGALVQRRRGPNDRDEQHVDARLARFLSAASDAVQTLADESEADAVAAQFYSDAVEGGDTQSSTVVCSSTEEASRAATRHGAGAPSTPLHCGSTAATTTPQAAATMPDEGTHVLVGELGPRAGLCFMTKPLKGYFAVVFEDGSWSCLLAGTKYQPCPKEQQVAVAGVVMRNIVIKAEPGGKNETKSLPEAFLHGKTIIKYDGKCDRGGNIIVGSDHQWEIFDKYEPSKGGSSFAEPRLPRLEAGNHVDCTGNVCGIGSKFQTAASGKDVIFVAVAQQRLKVSTRAHPPCSACV